MSQYVIEIDDRVLHEKLNDILNTVLNRELQYRYNETGHMVSAAIKDLVYSQKDRIIDLVVDKAAKEIVRKGLPKLLERSAE